MALGQSLQKHCSGPTAAAHSLTYYNLGVRRETSEDIAHRWKGEVLSRLPSGTENRLVFSFGTNDASLERGKPRVELPQTVQFTRQILRDAKFRFPTVMIGPPPIAGGLGGDLESDPEQNERLGQVSQAIAAVCQEVGVPFLEVFTPLSKAPVWIQEVRENDGSHPRAGGYAQWANLVQAWEFWQTWFPKVPMDTSHR